MDNNSRVAKAEQLDRENAALRFKLADMTADRNNLLAFIGLMESTFLEGWTPTSTYETLHKMLKEFLAKRDYGVK